ncbi:WRKY domain containing protein [Parasponia andersonii]|uniref:WRKY domain containing protein n=1 Tax=Parasponia andersonii TaxID=3476 RepID=A0A2P5CHL3_PARAD|nr:WRKY domain containing protein [Parasponia andersonii]
MKPSLYYIEMGFDPSAQENAPSGRRKVIDELVQGRELANQLHSLLAKSDQNDVSSAEDLVSKIMESFTNTLFMLNNRNSNYEAKAAAAAAHDDDDNDDEAFDVVSQVQPASTTSPVDSPCLDGRKSEDSQESCRSTSVISTTSLKDRRGSYKRRKTSHTWKRESPTLIDDGFAWRKYGQKVILNAKYPRNYFRCTHKYDQGCLATKQVQKMEEEPPMYRTTYYGDHTCRNLLKAPELVLDCTSPTQDSSILLSFNDANLNLASKQASHPFFSSFQSLKQEFKDDNPIITSHNYQTSSSNYIVSPDHHLTALIHRSPLESDHIHGDMISEMIMDPFEDDVLQHLEF